MRDLRHVTKNQIFQVSEVMAFEKMSRDEAGKEFTVGVKLLPPSAV